LCARKLSRPSLLVVGNAFEAPAQFNSSREFTTLLVGGSDRSGVSFGDKERPLMMGKPGSVHQNGIV
jgi:hypothetical protein